MGMKSYRSRLVGVLSIFLTLSLLLPRVVTARPQQIEVGDPGAVAAAPVLAPGEGVSHRLIVQLESPSLAEWSKSTGMARGMSDRLDAKSPADQSYLAQLEREQSAFVNAMRLALPSAQVATYLDAQQRHNDESYQVVFNGMTIDPGTTPT